MVGQKQDNTTVFESPLSGTKYNIFKVSPYLIGLIMADTTESEQSRQLRTNIANVASDLQSDSEALARPDVTEEQKKVIQERMDNNLKLLKQYEVQLYSITKPKPKTVCEVVRTFVQECETMADRDLLHMGEDLDLLYMKIQTMSIENSDKYNKAIELFRQTRKSSTKSGTNSESVPDAAK